MSEPSGYSRHVVDLFPRGRTAAGDRFCGGRCTVRVRGQRPHDPLGTTSARLKEWVQDFSRLESTGLKLVDLTSARWNRTRAWLTNIAALRQTIVA
jgi:hypothetical protein